MSAKNPTQAEIEYYASLDAVRVQSVDVTGPALARKVLELQNKLQNAQRWLDKHGVVFDFNKESK